MMMLNGLLVNFTISTLPDTAWNPIIGLVNSNVSSMPTQCLCSVLCPVYIKTWSSVIHFPEFIHLTSTIPKISTFRRLAAPIISFLRTVWTFNVAIRVFSRKLHALTGWRSNVPYCCTNLLPGVILPPEVAVPLAPFVLFCLVSL